LFESTAIDLEDISVKYFDSIIVSQSHVFADVSGMIKLKTAMTKNIDGKNLLPDIIYLSFQRWGRFVCGTDARMK